MSEPITTTSITIPIKLLIKIKKLAKESRRSTSKQITMMLKSEMNE